MKKTLLVCALALSACGFGNRSNEDLEFYASLPERQDLQSKLPASSSSSALQQGLNAGDHSKAYDDTKTGSDGFNGFIETLLGFVDGVKQYPPTTRTRTAEGLAERVWGPFDDRDHAGYQWQVVMVQQSDLVTFNYKFQARKKGTVDWVDAFDGNFKSSTGKAGKGSGNFTLDIGAVRSIGLPTQNADNLSKLTVTYNLESFPFTVDATLLSTTDPALSYKYRELADKSGAIQFKLTGLAASASNPCVSAVTYDSFWLPSGAGRADVTIAEVFPACDPLLVGRKATECWDPTFTVSYSNNPFANPPEAPSGSVDACVARPSGL